MRLVRLITVLALLLWLSVAIRNGGERSLLVFFFLLPAFIAVMGRARFVLRSLVCIALSAGLMFFSFVALAVIVWLIAWIFTFASLWNLWVRRGRGRSRRAVRKLYKVALSNRAFYGMRGKNRAFTSQASPR